MSIQTDTIPHFTIQDRLRKAREHAGLTQDQLAAAMEVAKTTVSNYETGATTNLRRSTLRDWSKATGVPIEWLRWGVEPTSPGAADDPATRTFNDIGCIADRPRTSVLQAA